MLKEWNDALDQVNSSIHVIYLGDKIHNFKNFILNLLQHRQSFFLFQLCHGYLFLLLFSEINSLDSFPKIGNPLFVIQGVFESAEDIYRIKRVNAFFIFSFIFTSLDLIIWLLHIWIDIILVLDAFSIFNLCILNYSYCVAFTCNLTQRFHIFLLFILDFQLG
jgi:hypothetical protein